MGKREFIEELCKRLRLMSAEDAQKTVTFYSEAIDDRVEDGMSEEDAVESLGNIDDIVREAFETADSEKQGGSEYDGGASYKGCDENASEAYGEYGSVRVDRDGIYTYPRVNVEELRVYDSGTDITVKLSRDDMIYLICTGLNGEWYEVETGQIMTVKRLARNEVNVFGVSVTMPFSHSQGELTIELPRNMLQRLTMSVNTGSGDISVSLPNLKSLHVKSGSGDVTVNDMRESSGVTVNTASGDIEAIDVMCGKLSCGTASGDINVKEFRGGGLALNTASGDIEAERFSCGRLQFSTVSGDSNIEGSATERADAKSISGNMRIALYSATRNIIFDSVSGEIKAEIDANPDDYAITLRSATGHLSSPNGNPVGNKSVRGKTISGDIRVHFEKG